MIEAIIFDFGNVIYRFDRKIFLAELAARAGRPPEDLFRKIYDSDIPKRYELGEITSEEFYQLVCSAISVRIPKDEFIKAFNSIFEPVPGMNDLLRDLKKRYRLGLLSNTNELHFEHTIRWAEVFDLFDSVTLSYRVGEMKPGEKIYRDALSKLSLPPARCIYIDDVKKYADAATAIGMRGIHFTSRPGLIGSLREQGIELPG